MWFAVDADPQFKWDDDLKEVVIRKAKENNKKIMESLLNKDFTPEFLLVCGDLTQHGSDGKSQLDPANTESEDPDELGPFKFEYYRRMKNKLDGQVYLIHGNHDEYVAWPYTRKPVLDFIESEFGGTNYAFRASPNIKVIALGKYPDADSLDWLKEKVSNKDRKYIIFQHYPVTGDFSGSDWWSNDEKNAFYDVIKDSNIIAIFSGHSHMNDIREWKGIPNIVCGGKGMCLCNFEDDILSVQFIKEPLV